MSEAARSRTCKRENMEYTLWNFYVERAAPSAADPLTAPSWNLGSSNCGYTSNGFSLHTFRSVFENESLDRFGTAYQQHLFFTSCMYGGSRTDAREICEPCLQTKLQ